MRRLLYKAAAFFGITTICVLTINSFILNASRTYKDGASIICEEKRNAVRTGQVRAQAGRDSVLFLGNSRVLTGVVPRQFDELTGGRTYSWNCALPALPIGPHYFLLKDYLRHNPPPQFIVLSLSVNYGDKPGLFDRYALQGATFREIWSYGLNRRDKTVVWNYVHPVRVYPGEACSYLRNRLSDPQAVERTRRHNRAIVEEMLVERGYYDIREQAFPTGRLPDDFRGPSDGAPEQELQPERDPYVQSFFDLVQQEGIRVLLFEPPRRPGQVQQRAVLPATYRQIMKRYPNVCMAVGGWKLKFYENRLFSDPTHVNPEGAERLTREVCAEFVQAFSFR